MKSTLTSKFVLPYLCFIFIIKFTFNSYVVSYDLYNFNINYILGWMFSLLYYFYVYYMYYILYKKKTNYKTVILISILIPIISYHADYIGSNISYYFKYEKIYTNNSDESGFRLSEFINPLVYHPFYKIYSFFVTIRIMIINNSYISLIIDLLSNSIIGLYIISKILLFKKLNLNTFLSVFYPFNYFLLIEKYKLDNKWKKYINIPFVNLYFIYKINIRLCEELKCNQKDSIGLLFLPFIYYPKLIYNKNPR